MSNTIDTNDAVDTTSVDGSNFKFNDLREPREEIKNPESSEVVTTNGYVKLNEPQTANCDECDFQDNCPGCDVENDIDEGEGVKMYDPIEFNAGAKTASWYAGFVDQMEEVGLSPEQSIEFLKHKMTIDEEMELTRLNNVVALKIAERNWKDEKKGIL
jgi:hypothetical protein